MSRGSLSFFSLAVAGALLLASCANKTTNATSPPPLKAPATSTTLGDPTKVAAQPSSGCSAAAVPPGETKVTLTSGGADRWFFQHVPPQESATTPLPLIIDLHGYSEGAQVHTAMTGLGTYGDSHGFITVTPQGAGPVAMWDTTIGGTDLAFIGDLMDHEEQTLCVDERRVFTTGLSNGAFMTSAVACQFASRVAAVAPVAGISEIKGCAPSRPVPVVAFHGTADQFVSYDGGLGPAVANLPNASGAGKIGDAATAGSAAKGPSVPQITSAWAIRNGCTAKPTDTTVTSDVTLIGYSCPPGDDVELYRVTGGGHAWPGSQFSVDIAAVIGKTTMTISADDIIWKFFQNHPLPQKAPQS
jgi:polyhydroxybutyrate depolymerase